MRVDGWVRVSREVSSSSTHTLTLNLTHTHPHPHPPHPQDGWRRFHVVSYIVQKSIIKKEKLATGNICIKNGCRMATVGCWIGFMGCIVDLIWIFSQHDNNCTRDLRDKRFVSQKFLNCPEFCLSRPDFFPTVPWIKKIFRCHLVSWMKTGRFFCTANRIWHIYVSMIGK
jgi:hypothetical protein